MKKLVPEITLCKRIGTKLKELGKPPLRVERDEAGLRLYFLGDKRVDLEKLGRELGVLKSVEALDKAVPAVKLKI